MDNQKQSKAAHMREARAAPRCLAQNRSGKACQRPATKGKRRCHMHGGVDGIGAPKGNKNRLVHGHYSADAIAARRMVRAMLREARDLL